MRKRAERTLKELYDLTGRLSEPEITPVLKGSCRIQGPVDESDHELRTNSGIFPAEKKFTFVKGSLHMRAESGTCNVCSAPCSSCMHFSRTAAVMDSKIEGMFSGYTCGRKEADSCSFIGADGLPSYKSSVSDDRQHAASETSNLLCAGSSHDSYSENAESKATFRASVTYDASEDVEKLQKVSPGEAVGEYQLLPKQSYVTAHNALSSHSHTTSNLRNRIFSSQDEEQQGLECHGDNISCITGVRDASIAVRDLNVDLDKKDITCSSAVTSTLHAKGLQKAVQVEPAHDSCDHEIEESQSNSGRPSTCPKDSLRQKSPGTSSANAGFPHKSLKNNPTELQFSCPHSQHELFSNHGADPKGLEENSSSQLQGEPSESFMDHVESSLPGQRVNDSVDGRKSTTCKNYENNKAICIRSHFSSGALKDTPPCLETEFDMDGGIPSDEAVKCSMINEQFEHPSTLLETSNMHGPQIQTQPTSECGNSESDIVLDDVKVCDICGDAGREEFLAICSRCTDGAEHTYCMRVMLDKIPEGEWLCEECKLKDNAENQKLDKSETVSGISTVPCLNENSLNSGSTFNPKLLPKLDTKVIEPEVRGAIKGLQSPHITAKQYADHVEVTSVTSKRASEISGSAVTASPRKKPILSHDSSFKSLDMGKVRPSNLGPLHGGQSANSFQAIARSQTLSSSNSLKDQTRLQSPRGLLTKSVSFNNSNMKPKVKQLDDNFPRKQTMTREFASSDKRKEGLTRTITKSASFRSVGSGRSNIEPLNSPRTDDPRDLKPVKERVVVEQKNSFISDRPLVSPSPVAGTSISHPKVDLKVAEHDEILNNLFESDILAIKEGLTDTKDSGCNEVKKQSAYRTKSFESPSSSGVCNSEDQKPCQGVLREGARASSSSADRSCSDPDTTQCSVPRSGESTYRDEKTKDPTFFSSSRQSVSAGSRILRCQRCNETGHATQFCSIDKLRVSALKPSSAERNLREGTKKSNKWKDTVEAAKTRIQKNNRLPDQSEFTRQSADMSCELASSGNLASSSSLRNLPFLEGTTDGQEVLQSSAADPSRTAAVIDVNQQTIHPVETASVPRADCLNVLPTVSDELNVRTSKRIMPKHAVLANPLRASAIPVHEFIWQGAFEVQRTGRLPDLCDGVQAHLSTCASPKVLEVVTKIPCKIQLEEVPCLSSWPLQFQGNFPTENNIALFFFAKDIESYEKYYRKLLENMLKNDLALKGDFDGIELLIFPSNKLPENSQRWNRLFFLWGIFRGTRRNCLEALPGFQKLLFGTNLNMVPLVQDFPTPLMSEVSTSPTIFSYENVDKEFSICDRSPKAKRVKSTTCVDVLPFSSSESKDRICQTPELLVQKSVSQAAIDNNFPAEQTSCPFPIIFSSEVMSEQPSLHDSCPGSRLQMSTAQLCSKVKSDVTFLKKLHSNLDDIKDPERLDRVHADCPQISLSKEVLPTYSIASNCRQGVEGGRSEEIIKGNGHLMKSGVALDNDLWVNLAPTDHLSWESRPKRKYANLCSMEAVSPASSEISNNTVEAIFWKEKMNSIAPDDGKECKKMKLNSEGCASSSSSGENVLARLSSKIHPLLGIYLNDGQQRESMHKGSAYDVTTMPERSSSAERYSFSVDLGPVRDAKSEDCRPVHMLSFDNADLPESNAPNLELALWSEKKSPEQKICPFSPLVDKSSNQGTMHGPAADDGDDLSASLSLSLAFPFSEEQRTAKQTVSKAGQLLSERPCINTSLLLFGGFTDT